jgi:hypothetical protein
MTLIYTGDPTSLGGGAAGKSVKQTKINTRGGEQAATRKIITKSWNTPYARGIVGDRIPVIGPFRLVNNLGDFLNRQNYSCGGSNQIRSNRPGLRSIAGSIPQNCDATGIAASSCNPKFVPDSSDYVRYKKQRATNLNYNDTKSG